ncbi:HTH-type transcriptional regulator tcmR [Actinoplanes sp. SE50]|uniref:TetR/AcrR family transcriptional regulator n=1 Tax=unclassified Actinoplanes TaxID=2626549 RepID=UPI00023EC7F2|nr:MULTISPECIES: TetR family transcriptional regulator [unclassified Actinoplanes]AEV85334.1 HTH-type transcriptional regulator tcmR [Actinoplanes sp. SE50/110]ATO83729.1 HTH-type transcriptional regulator tcmR [Actinoplanes sp. SE50]SLM01137.1 TetR family transcriptional regulator [Actinoplanes sp. SE50/110]
MGLRERKKRQTRELISGVATEMFVQRGFDLVTVAEVAAAAGVSEKTVFNYFPRKEDLFLDRLPELLALTTEAVRNRPEGTSVLAAFRGVVFDLLAAGHPLSAYPGRGHAGFYRVVVGSPALQARVREFQQELEDLLVELARESSGRGGGEGELRLRLAAAVTVAAYRTVYFRAAARVLAGEDPVAVGETLFAEYAETFAAAEKALS